MSKKPTRKRGPSKRQFKNSYGLNFETLEPRQMLSVSTGSSWPNIDPSSTWTTDQVAQENVVRDYLDTNEATAYLQEGNSDLRLVDIEHGLASTTTHFQQVVDGLPVHGAFVTVNQGPNGEFQQVHDSGFENLQTQNVMGPVISMEMAEGLALNNVGATETFADSRGEMVWYASEKNIAVQSWQMTVYAADPTLAAEHVGDFLTIISPETGQIEYQRNNASFANGYVYLPNPTQELGLGLGGVLFDNFDATSLGLDTLRTNVTLQGLDVGTDLLIGEYADVATLTSAYSLANSIDADEATGVYEYDRDDGTDNRFEQVNVYYHIDSVQRHIQALGFSDSNTIPNGIRDFPTLAQAHWDNTTDTDGLNSFYSTGNDALHFDDGGIDDAEDGDLVVHEYAHAIQHDQNALWDPGTGEMGPMGEGFAEYLAASFFFTEGNAGYQASDAAAVQEWNAADYNAGAPNKSHRVDEPKHYPEDLTGDAHEDGEIWSRALWDIGQAIGFSTADQIILESHFALPAGATMFDGALAIVAADGNLNAGANESAIRTAFVDRGILEPLPYAGIVTFDSDFYNVVDSVNVNLIEANAGPGPISVTVSSSGGDSETFDLILNAPVPGSDPGINVYDGSILSDGGAFVQEDGLLQVALGDLITVNYQDADTTDGGGVPGFDEDNAVIANIMVYPSTDTPLPITSLNTTTSIINVPDVGAVGDVNVEIDITHTWDSDLVANLESPNGTVVELFFGVGGSGDNFTDTVLNDEATTPITSGTAPFTGEFQPSGFLGDFDLESITGDWTLTVFDRFNGDVGDLLSWSLIIDVVPLGVGTLDILGKHFDYSDTIDIEVFDLNAVGPVTVDVAVESGDSETMTLTDAGGGLWTGSIDVDAGPGVFSTGDGLLTGDPADKLTFTYFDADDGSGFGADRVDETNIKNIITHVSTEVPQDILSLETTVATIDITDPGTIVDLNVGLDITHTWDSDLVATLIGPGGESVELFFGVGGSGDNFVGTVLDSEAATPIGSGSAPFTGVFAPTGDLSVFDGQTQTGLWTLEVFDRFNGDVGTLDGFYLDIDVDPVPVSTIFQYNSTDVPVGFIDNATVVSTLEITDTGMIADLDVGMDLTHTWDSDLIATLIAPDGTAVELFRQVGGSGDNFTGTILNDEAATSINAGTAPFTGEWIPQEPLDVLDGLSITGIWTLSIEDVFGGDTGNIEAWGLTIDVVPTVEYPSTDTPLFISNTNPGTLTTSTINVPDSGTVGDIDLALDITHTWDSDLIGTLTSPTGTVVPLFTQLGGSGDDFTGTYFDDEASTAITAGSAPFTGFFTPEGDFTALEGESITGDWVLDILDVFGGDDGSLLNWSVWLDITPTVGGADINISDPVAVEGDSGTTDALFEITLSSPAVGTVTVDYTTADGSAIAGVDYVATSGTATFLDGESSVFVPVPVNGEQYLEADETFDMVLSGETGNAVILDGLGEATIPNDDVFANDVIVDFGTDTSPVLGIAVGFRLEDYSVDIGAGWSSYVDLTSAEKAVGNDLARDLAQMRSGTFSIDVPNDTYDVQVYYGVVRRRDPFRITFESDPQVTEFLTFGTNVSRIYQTTVADGQLNMAFTGAPGLDPFARISGFKINPVVPKGPSDLGGKGIKGDLFVPQMKMANTDPIMDSGTKLGTDVIKGSELAGSVVMTESTLDSFFDTYTEDDAKSESVVEMLESAIDELFV